ncbi:DUF2398 family protein [candidate division KSB1 bacterium]|nr:DUF2398 family protein [candidate division KSB1 bacterium]
MSTEFFSHLNLHKVRQLLNILQEAPYFYRDDNPNLFAFLKQNRLQFERFYQHFYGWEIVVDQKCARLYKPEWHNETIKPSQRDLFQPTRRNDCIAFLLVLEFYEHLLEEQNLTIEDPNPQFYFGELLEFAHRRLQEELGEKAPDMAGTREILRKILPALMRYRFLRDHRPTLEDGDIAEDKWIYECLPALYHYDSRIAANSIYAAFFGPNGKESVDEATAGEEKPDENFTTG